MIYFDLVSMIDNILVAGVTPAEKLLELYNEKWGQSVDPVFEELLYWGELDSWDILVDPFVCKTFLFLVVILVVISSWFSLMVIDLTS